MNKHSRICIVGAGLLGLVCGRRLAQMGFSVQIVEQHSVAGGMLSTTRFGEEYIELLPHHIRRQDRHMIDLFHDLDLQSDLEWFDAYWYGKVRKRKLGYPKSGFHSFLTALIADIENNGGTISYGYTVMDIRQTNASFEKYRVSCALENGKTVEIKADIVLFTASCRNFAHITNTLQLPTDYRDPLMDVSYMGSICLLLLSKIHLSECYSKPLLTLTPFQKMIEHTNLVGSRHYGGHVLYLTGLISPSDPIWTKSDADVYKICFSQLNKMVPTLKKNSILTWRLTRTRYAMPLSRAADDLIKAKDGLFLCSMAMSGTDLEYRMDNVVEKALEVCSLIEKKYKKA